MNYYDLLTVLIPNCNLRRSSFLKFDRILRYLVVTPDMHRVHHSVIIRETNSNYGFNLSRSVFLPVKSWQIFDMDQLIVWKGKDGDGLSVGV